jgi:hypothetical protein
MRNVGMVFGIAVAGAMLYAVTPSYIFQKVILDGSEAAVFLTGLRYAYLSGAALSVSAGITSCIRRMDKNSHR